jgi:hypothetical protein
MSFHILKILFLSAFFISALAYDPYEDEEAFYTQNHYVAKPYYSRNSFRNRYTSDTEAQIERSRLEEGSINLAREEYTGNNKYNWFNRNQQVDNRVPNDPFYFISNLKKNYNGNR